MLVKQKLPWFVAYQLVPSYCVKVHVKHVLIWVTYICEAASNLVLCLSSRQLKGSCLTSMAQES